MRIFGLVFVLKMALAFLLAVGQRSSVIAFQSSASRWAKSSRNVNHALAVTASPLPSMSFSTKKKKKPILDPLVVCGPSGVGKGTIISRFMQEFGGNDHFGFTTSHTTRKPREGEVDGVHYHFVSREDMKKLIDSGKFLEHAEVHGNFYGTSWDSLDKIQDEGRACLLDIDVNGIKTIKAREQANNELSSSSKPAFKPNYVFIAPPSVQILEKRLVGRGTESAESLERRTKNARAEVEWGLAEGNVDAIIVNDDLDKACADFCALIRKIYGL